MTGVDPRAFEFALAKIRDGYIFEKFSLQFLAYIFSYEFIPVGRVKDRGIDGLEHLYSQKGIERNIFQISIDKNCKGKLENTLKTLIRNNIRFKKLNYVTNLNFPNKDKAIDEFVDTYSKAVSIYDLKWLSSHVNDTPSTVNTYKTFLESYFHEFSQPGKAYEVGDLVEDPRLFVFLRQQWDADNKKLEVDEILADTLILYCLEGTDPDKGIFKTIIRDVHAERALLFSMKGSSNLLNLLFFFQGSRCVFDS